MALDRSPTTGLPGLDAVLSGLEAGDNVVWEVHEISDYQEFVLPYGAAARAEGRRLIYFRFADEPPLLSRRDAAEQHDLDPAYGFEFFVRKVHAVIESAGPGTAYVFDCLSSLAEAWGSDQSLSNFFQLTCPRLSVLETVTYFGIYRDLHSPYAVELIRATTQFMLDVFRFEDRLYLRPLKVQRRSQEVMKTLHVRSGEIFRPVKDSAVLAPILSQTRWPRLHTDQRTGYWRRLFHEADRVAEDCRKGACSAEHLEDMLRRVRWAFGVHRSSIVGLVERYLTLDDFLAIRDRMIGTGSVGGKTLGMLVGRAILRERDPDLFGRLEAHDSFFVGGEVFITFLVQNQVWWLREQQNRPELFLQNLEEGRKRILEGQFAPRVLEQFQGMLDYFGESPYIVRSSSILEDAGGSAFASKYESIFVVNRGSREQRMQALLAAVRRVYASVLDEEALLYRQRRGLLETEERMSLLIMRVSGAPNGRYYYPQAAGVALSFNPFVWHKEIEPRAGVVRLVFGLGTRAVNRSDDDYTRLVALNAPFRRPDADLDDVCEHSQKRMDCLDLDQGEFVSVPFREVLEQQPGFPLDLYLSRTNQDYPVITFERLLRETFVVRDLRRMLELLEAAYQRPVDVEFTINFLSDGSYRIHLLQCRTFQIRRELGALTPPVQDSAIVVLAAHGAVIGVSREQALSRIIYVATEKYAALPEQSRYAVARLIGRLNKLHAAQDRGLMLIGPGRWGTQSPSLGIPVSFSEISRAAVVVEVVAMHEHLVPDVSLGTHFFNDVVEHDMLYVAYFPTRTGNRLDDAWFRTATNCLLDLEPSATALAEVVRVIECGQDGQQVWLRADATAQEALLFTRPDSARTG